MSNHVRCYGMVVFFAVVGLFFLSGCQGDGQSAEPELIEPNRVVVIDCIVDYQSRYIGADEGRYVSEQVHEIGIDNKFLQINATEPGGKLEAMLKNRELSVVRKGSIASAILLEKICDKSITNGLLKCIC